MANLRWSQNWSVFASWRDFAFAFIGLLFCLLLILWWRQQSWSWLRVTLVTLLLALLLSIVSSRIFVVPPHMAGCTEMCDGWRGFPLRYAVYKPNGISEIGAADFALNVLLIWLLILATTAVWRVLSTVFGLEERGRRWRFLTLVTLLVVPWALLPRILNPPQPQVSGEELRLANNALRAAEFTYGITGFWVHRLSLEDVKRNVSSDLGVRNLVCLRGYTLFFVPWRHYLITLDDSGATALGLNELPLSQPCWPTEPS